MKISRRELELLQHDLNKLDKVDCAIESNYGMTVGLFITLPLSVLSYGTDGTLAVVNFGDDCCCKLRDFPEYACKIIGNIHEQKD